MKNKIIHTIIALMLWVGILAQNYPIQVFLQVSPPFSSYLQDYADPSNEQLKVFITLTDITVPAYDVKIKFKFQGNGYSIENPTYLNLPPITITPGVPYVLSGAALATYLNSQNLTFSGINSQDYENRKVLPEGPCNICVEIYDYNSSTLLATQYCTNVWFSMYDPPFLNTPFCGNEVDVSTPQQILFNWTPLNMNSPFSLNTTEYVFELFEKRPKDADPNVVVNSTLPIYLQVTNQPFINYGITEPQLQVGQKYVWRVRVRDNSNRDYFKNKGYSQVCEFTYGNITNSQISNIDFNLQANGTGARKGYAWWNDNSIFNNYQLKIRKTGNSNYRWFPFEANNPNIKIYSLEPETEYECRVRGIVGPDSSDWSNIAVFTTKPITNYACGNTTLPATQTNIVPLVNATKGMVLTIGQFEMMVTRITPLPTDGHYKGTGKISIPFMFTNLNVSFEDILIDENLIIRSGKVKTITQGVDKWLGNIDIDKAKLNPTHIDGVIDSVYFINDSVALVQFGNQQFQIDSFPAAIYDKEGNVYHVFEDGTIIKEFNGTISEDKLDVSDSLQVIFEHLNEQNYGFDAFENALWTDSYEVIELSSGKRYFVPYKSILTNATDYVLAKVRSKNNLTISNITFKCLDGRNLTSEKINDSTYKVTLDQFNANEEAVYAMWNNSKVGKLNVRAYDYIQKEVVIVPVNGAQVGNKQHIENLLNKTYKQAVVNWNVTIDSNFVNTTWDANADGKLANADATLMTKYSTEMRALRDAYLNSNSQIDNRKNILFVVPNFEDNSTLGYMVRGKGVGFLSENPLVKTIAHELGHGAFGLYHTFPKVPQGSTKNLLDYNTNSNGKLNKVQWEKIHKWSPNFSMFDEEEEGEMQAVNTIFYLDDLPTENSVSTNGVQITSNDLFYTKWGNFIHFDANEISQIDDINIVNKKLKKITLNGNGSKSAGNYVYGAIPITHQLADGTLQQTATNPSSYFICIECCETGCNLVSEWDNTNNNCQKRTVVKNGATKYIYRNVPTNYRLNIVNNKQPCNTTQDIVINFTNNQPVYGKINNCDNVLENGNGNTISTNIEVELIELPENEVPFFVSNDYNWLDLANTPIGFTNSFSELTVQEGVMSFKYNGEKYIGLYTKTSQKLFVGYVNETLFKQKLATLNGEPIRKYHITDDMLFSNANFLPVNNGDEVHYRIYDRIYENCIAYREYNFNHIAGTNYTFNGAMLINEVEETIVFNSTCPFHTLVDALCDGGAMTAEGLVNIIDLATEQIPVHFYDPTNAEYNSFLYDAYVNSSPTNWIENDQITLLKFAYLCGAYNGVIGEIEGLGNLSKLLNNYFCDPNYRDNLNQTIASVYENPSQIKDAITTKLEQDFVGKNEYLKAEMSGRYSVVVASVVIPLTKTNWASKLTKIKQLPKLLNTFIIKLKKGTIEGFKVVRNNIYGVVLDVNIPLASFSDDLLIIEADKFITNYLPSDVVEEIGEITYKTTIDPTEYTKELVLIKKTNGNIGIGRKVANGVDAFGKYSTKFDDFVEVLQKETLFGDDALTFLDAEYRTVKTTTSVTSYRAFGGNAKVGGTFVTTTKDATRNELAVLDDWNSMRFEAKIEIPPQTKINIGKVGPQTSDDGLQVLTGGGDQVILPFQWNTQWVKEIKDLNTGTIYNSVDEFKIDFPHLVD